MVMLQASSMLLMAGGIAYLLLALWHVFRLAPGPAPVSPLDRPVSVMVPAHGLTPRLEECLRSICDQHYRRFQVVFGLHGADDPSRPVIERLIAAFPGLDAALVIDGRRHGANPKNTNLANMLPATRHDLLVMVDSDVLVGRDFLATMVAPLADPAVGGVTCLYSGAPAPGLASRLGALYINDWFIPSALVDLARGEMSICYGAAIATTRAALEAIGGFSAMADAVAQDYVFAHRLRQFGYRLRLAPVVVATVVAEPGLGALLRHELRWSRAVRAVRPLDHAGSLFMSTLVPGGLLMLVAWPAPWALAAIALHLALRLALHLLLRHRLDLPPSEPWLVPLREAINLAVWTTALLGRKVRWGASVMVTGAGLTMRADHSGPPSRPQTAKDLRRPPQ